MAFLDNSGDIILDAVLTDIGVEKMASGEFKITKFALGDDEINYGLYDKNNTGGPAYYDLEILQTPVLEAFASQAGTINYGLVTLPTSLLYMPTLKVNEKTLGLENKIAKNGVFYVTDTTNDSGTTTISSILSAASISYMAGTMTANAGYVLIECGIESSDLQATQANVRSYITEPGLRDTSLNVSYDTRVCGGVMGLRSSSRFANDGSSNTLDASIALAEAARTSQSPMQNYGTGRVQALINEVYTKTGGNDTKSTYSTIEGPTATFAAVSPNVKVGLDTSMYTKYGTRNATPDSVATAISYIDSVIYIQGASSGAAVQLTMRIARRYVA